LSDLLVAARAVHFASTAMLAGLLLFVLFVGEPVLRKASCGATFRGRLLGIGWASLAVSLASGMLWLVLLAFDVGGHSWRALISANVLPTLLTETRFGNDWLIRWGFSALLAVCLYRFHRERGWRSRGEGWAGALLGAGLMASLAWAGHGSGDSGDWGRLHVAGDALHLVAAGAWIGALPPLVLLLAWAQRIAGEHSIAMAAEATSRFSLLGIVAVSTLLATGILNSLFLVGSLPRLFGTDYGRLVLAKIGLFAAMLSIAAVNRFRLLPLLSGQTSGPALRRLRRNGLIETGLGFLVLAIVGVLGTMPPATHVQAWWPFPFRLDAEIFDQPEQRLALLGIAAAAAATALSIAGGFFLRRWRWPLFAAGAALLVWAGERLPALTTDAYPTSFYVSPTGYSAHSIAAGQELFAEHCASCHGANGRGDGPVAANLPKPPADLTAEHIYGHSEGDLFWWISSGLGEAMPAFAAVLDERARWNLIDFIHANADARRLAEAMHHGASVALPTPGFSADCPDGSTVSVERLRGKVLHLTLAGPRSTHIEGLGARSETTLLVRAADAGAPFLCGTRDPDLVQTFALYRGTTPDRIERTEFLVDASGWLRAIWWPGITPDWSEPAVLAREIEKIHRAPGEPRPAAPHVH
jgi:copper resistance protein D